MGILIKEIRLRNFRSYESADIRLPFSGVLIGSNNVGKSSLLNALQVVFDRGIRASGEDIFIKDGEDLTNGKKAIIDILIEPKNSEDKDTKVFSDTWFDHFGDLRSEDLDTLDQFVAIRATIQFNVLKGEYDIERKALIEWPKSEDVESYSDYKKNRITERLLQSIPVFYLDAKRDISTEMKDKYSYWSKLVRDVDLANLKLTDLEKALNDINEEIIQQSPVLEHLSKNLNQISQTVNTKDSRIIINPVSRKIRDLNRGMDITFKDQKSESFPISNHGMGTRSWITFLTLVAYIEWKVLKMKEEKTPYHPIILLEEPEAHLHPQAQRKIYKQIQKIEGQKIVSTHSPNIVGHAILKDILHVSKRDGISKVNYINLQNLKKEEIRKIQQEIFRSRGDILFADAIILCEGETEEQALPEFFKEYFGEDYFDYGINIISVGGFGKYKPFLQVAKDFDIKFYILSDGETETIEKVSKDIRNIFGSEKKIDEYNNIKFLPNKCDFENYLLQEGYEKELTLAVEDLFGEDYIKSFISKKNGTKKKRREKTDEICETCEQHIFMDLIRDYSGEAGFQKAILDCIQDNKTSYSSVIAPIIIAEREGDERVPKLIRDLFNEINKDIGIIGSSEEVQDVFVDQKAT